MHFRKSHLLAFFIMISVPLSGCTPPQPPNPLTKIADRSSKQVGELTFDQVTHDGVTSMGITPNGRSLVTSNGSQLFIWDLATKKLEGEIKEDKTDHAGGRFQSVFLSQDNEKLVSIYKAFLDGIKIWDLRTGAMRTFSEPGGEYLNLAIASPDGKFIVCGKSDGTIAVWNLATGHIQLKTERKTGFMFNEIYAIAISPDSQTLITITADGHIELLDLNTGRLKAQTHGYARWQGGLAINPAGDLFVNGGADGVVRVWSMNRATLHAGFKGHRAKVTAVAFSPDAQMVASGDEAGVVNLWNLNTGTLELTLPDFTAHALTITSIVFTPDGKSLIAGGLPHSQAYQPRSIGYASAIIPNQLLQTTKLWDLQSLRLGKKP
jgi:WD40 repeat protein